MRKIYQELDMEIVYLAKDDVLLSSGEKDSDGYTDDPFEE